VPRVAATWGTEVESRAHVAATWGMEVESRAAAGRAERAPEKFTPLASACRAVYANPNEYVSEANPQPAPAEETRTTLQVVRQSMTGFTRKPIDVLRKFLGETIWQWDLTRLSRGERLGAQVLRMIYLVGRAFVAQRAQLQAMALTYTTMLALVPAFAIVVAMFSVQGLREVRSRIELFIVEFLAASPEQQLRISSYLHEQADTVTQNGGVAGVAFLVFLFLTVISLLGTLERTLNQVWGVRKQRSFLSKFVTYWCVATLGPIFLGLALVHGSQLEEGIQDLAQGRSVEEVQPDDEEALSDEDLFGFSGVGGALTADPERDLETTLRGTRAAPGDAFSLLPFGLSMVTFFLIYAFLPNTKVRLKPAIIGAFTAAVMWGGTKWALAASSATLVKYNAVYGGLATIPITMVWIYVTWLIVILGAEVTFALQNLGNQRNEELSREATELCKEIVALRVCACVARAFHHGDTPPHLDALAIDVGAPHALVSYLVYHLTQDGLLREVERKDESTGFIPARPTESVTLSDVIHSLRERAGVAFDLTWGEDLPVLHEHLGRANAAFSELAQRISLRDVVTRVDRRLASGKELRPELAAVSVVTAQAIAGVAEEHRTLRPGEDPVHDALEAGDPDSVPPAAPTEPTNDTPQTPADDATGEEAPAPAVDAPGSLGALAQRAKGGDGSS